MESLQQKILRLTKCLEQLQHHSEEAAEESSQMQERYREQKRPLKRLEGKIALNDLFQGRLDLDRNKVRISHIRHFFDNENDHII